MANATTVTLVNGVPTAPSGTVSTIDALMADGGQVTLGATTDAVVAAGAAGSVSAKLRAISRDIVSNIVLAAGAHVIGAVTQSGSWVLSAGSALIGKVGIDQTTQGTTNGVVVNSSALPTGAATAANQVAPNTATGANLSASVTLPATTTAYAAGQLIANNATAGSVANLTWTTSGSVVRVSRIRIHTNDTTSTSWPSAQIQIDLWSSSPTWTNGDRGTWSPATGTASHLGSFQGTMSAIYGDGAYAECFPIVGNDVLVTGISGNTIYGSLQAVNGSGVTGNGKTFGVILELKN